MDNKIKQTFRKSGVKTDIIKEKVAKKWLEERIDYCDGDIEAFIDEFGEIVDLTIKEHNKERDKWIDKAREIENLPQGEDHDYYNYQTRCEEFVEKISNTKKSDE